MYGNSCKDARDTFLTIHQTDQPDRPDRPADKPADRPADSDQQTDQQTDLTAEAQPKNVDATSLESACRLS